MSFLCQELRDFSDWFGPSGADLVEGAKSTETRYDVRRTVTVAQRKPEETPRGKPKATEFVSGIVLRADV